MPRDALLSTSAPLLHRVRAGLIAVLLPFALVACASDASKSSPSSNVFAKKVLDECGSKHLGALSISDLMNPVSPRYSAYLVSITSRFGQGGMTWDEYVRGVMTVEGGGGQESPGLSCIKALKL